MLRFAAEKAALPLAVSVHEVAVDQDVLQALAWAQVRTNEMVINEREKVMKRIETRAAELVSSGEVERWFSQADQQTKMGSEGINGPLWRELAEETGFTDANCVESFRHGAPVLGLIPAAASAEPHEYPQCEDVTVLAGQCAERNRELVASLRQDKHEEFPVKQTEADAALGRMTTAGPVSELDLSRVVLARRFSREQGLKANGDTKLRAVDFETANGVNRCAQATGKNRNDGIDVLVRCAVLIKVVSGRSPAFWKADIDSAFRRVPIRTSDRWASWVTFLYKGTPMAACHQALMFGSLGSVHGWDRPRALLRHLGRKLLHLALNRYVDDYFCAEAEGVQDHAME